MSYLPPPQISSADLRPKRVWYWIAGAITVLGICIGGGAAAFGFTSLAGDLPTMKQEFDPGSSATVTLSKGEWAIYADKPGSGGASAARPTVECSGDATDGGNIEVSESLENFDYPQGNHQWHLVYRVTVDESGSYEIQCTTDDTGVEQFAVGDPVNVGGFVGKTFGSLGALCGIPCIGFFVAGMIALITGLRRSSHRKRLQQQPGMGMGMPPGAMPGPPGPPPAAP